MDLHITVMSDKNNASLPFLGRLGRRNPYMFTAGISRYLVLLSVMAVIRSAASRSLTGER